jgi:hypothetical protein
LILLNCRQRREDPAAEPRLAVILERGERNAVTLLRHDRRLQPLRRRAVRKWRTHVEVARIAKRACQLAINEDCTANLFAARPGIVWRDQPVRDRLHGRGLVSGEIKPRASLHRNWRRRVVWFPRQAAAIATAQRRQPEAPDCQYRCRREKASTRDAELVHRASIRLRGESVPNLAMAFSAQECRSLDRNTRQETNRNLDTDQHNSFSAVTGKSRMRFPVA